MADRTLDTDRLLRDMRKLVASVREHYAKTNMVGAPGAIAVMFAMLDEQIMEKGRLPAEWRAAMGVAES